MGSGLSAKEFNMSHDRTTSASSAGWSTKNLAWGCIGSFVVGAALLYGTGFYWLGEWQTGTEVQKKLAVGACVQEFLLQPDRGVIYAQLKDTSSAYQRRQLLQKNKWALDRDIADLCDARIRSFDASAFPEPQEADTGSQQPT